MKKKLFSAILAGLLLVSGVSVRVHADGGNETTIGTDGKLYYTDSEGNNLFATKTGWQEIIDDNGRKTRVYVAEDHSLVTGWELIEGSWRYFDTENGSLSRSGYPGTNREFMDPETGKYYLVDNEGKNVVTKAGWNYIKESYDNYWVYGIDGGNYGYAVIDSDWLSEGGVKYYFYEFRMAENTSFSIDDKVYAFAKSGAMLTKAGWAQVGDDWVYVTGSGGECATGWIQDGGKYYYMYNGDGIMASDCVIDDEDGSFYAVAKSGEWITEEGWYRVNTQWRDNDWVYIKNGKCLTGKQTINGKQYYFTPSSGIMACGTCTIDGVQEVYAYSGERIQSAGWKLIESRWYYLKADGSPAPGWLEENGKTYFIDSTGVMATGLMETGNDAYLFAQNGELLCKFTFEKDEEGIYPKYYKEDGSQLEFGWHTVKGYRFYIDKYGFASFGRYIDGYSYIFDGRIQVTTPGWYKLGNVYWYYINTDGTLKTGWMKDGNTWYFMNETKESLPYIGIMNSNQWKKDGDAWYWLKSSGAMASNEWLQIRGSWYYFFTDGHRAENMWIGNYYLGDDGSMATNAWIGQWYVGADGAWVPNKKK